tara:strand:- start:798 stop:1334 length:537 start_codon:yes stop_codon:yes gene_type:complete
MEELENAIKNIDDNWINDFEEEDEFYKDFYKEPQSSLNIVYSYIDKNNNIVAVKKENIEIKNNILDKDKLIEILNEKMKFNGSKYRPISLLKWNIDIDSENINEYLSNEDKYNNRFLNIEKEIKDIIFEESAVILHDINRLYIFFHESWDSYNNRTKKIFVKSSTKLKNKKQTKRLKN